MLRLYDPVFKILCMHLPFCHSAKGHLHSIHEMPELFYENLRCVERREGHEEEALAVDFKKLDQSLHLNPCMGRQTSYTQRGKPHTSF